jgi:predicted RNA-binding protein YlxR (DUF448 family)
VKPRPRRRRPARRRSRTTAVAQSAARIFEPADGAAKSPQRRCIVTGEIRERSSLLRFVVGPGGVLAPDVEARLPGRGLWLTPRRDIVERAVSKRLFARAARQSVSVPEDLAERVEALLARRCGDAIGFARRAGAAVAGFDRVVDTVRRGRAALLLFARDGAEGGRRKLAGLGRDLPAASVLTAAELGAAFGRERIVHAALGAGPLCERLGWDLKRLAGFRPDPAIEDGIDFGAGSTGI